MWTAKFKVFDNENELSVILRRNKVRVHYYPVNYYVKEDRYFFVTVGIVEADKDKKDNFSKALSKLKRNKDGRRLELLERDEDFFVVITSHTKDKEMNTYVSVAYNPSLIHFEPVLWSEDGWETWKIASLERKDIEKLIKVAETKYKIELMQFSNKKIKNFGFMTLLPTLSEKQKKAINLAVKEGYYKYPRDKDLQDLAKMVKTSFSTFQEHIRRAENKIIPFATKQI